MNMEAAGYGSDVLAKALELSDAAATLIASGMTAGFERFEALRHEYQDESWFKHARGNFTHVLLSLSPAELRENVQCSFSVRRCTTTRWRFGSNRARE